MTAGNLKAPVPLPMSMAAALAGYQWTRDGIGQSGSAVYRLHGKLGAPDLFLKHGSDAVADEIADEMVRLRWLASYMPVPTVESFCVTPREAWLLTTAIPGESAYQAMHALPDARIAVVDALATFLRRLHAVPLSDCPFASDHAYRIARARERIDAGLVDEDDFDDEREDWTAEQVWEAMQQLLPFESDPVVTHGDFSLDNILMHNGEAVGCIDVGRAGIADRYQDIAIVWNGLGDFGAPLQDRFLAQYGIAALNRRKLEFHRLLDELF